MWRLNKLLTSVSNKSKHESQQTSRQMKMKQHSISNLTQQRQFCEQRFFVPTQEFLGKKNLKLTQHIKELGKKTKKKPKNSRREKKIKTKKEENKKKKKRKKSMKPRWFFMKDRQN